jgi:hypothetical protein
MVPSSYSRPCRRIPLMIARPRNGIFFWSPSQRSQRGFGSSPGSMNILAMRPSKRPSRSANRNQPSVLPVAASTCCHKPVTTGSSAGALSTARSASQAAAKSVCIGRIIRIVASSKGQVSPVAFQCGDFQETYDVRARVRSVKRVQLIFLDARMGKRFNRNIRRTAFQRWASGAMSCRHRNS